MENPEEVAKTARKIIERLGGDSEDSKEAPESDEVTFAKTLLLSKRADERYELVNGMKANAIPLQIALGAIPDSKWDKVCIEALKGYGENSMKPDTDRGQFLTTGKPPQKVKLTPREQELAYIANLPRKAEEPNIVSNNCLLSEPFQRDSGSCVAEPIMGIWDNLCKWLGSILNVNQCHQFFARDLSVPSQN